MKRILRLKNQETYSRLNVTLYPDCSYKCCTSQLLCFHSLSPRDYNSYGSRRGNDAVMARGTFANIRLFNKFLSKQAPQTLHLPTGETVSMQHLSLGYMYYYMQTNSCVFRPFCPAGCVWCCREIPAGRSPSGGPSREGIRLRQLQRLGSKGPLSTGEDHFLVTRKRKYIFRLC